MLFVALWAALFCVAVGLVAGICLVLDWWRGETGPMYAGNRRHRLHLRRLAREDTSTLEERIWLAALTSEDQRWLRERGWVDPHAGRYFRYGLVRTSDPADGL